MSNFAFGTYRISDYNPQHIEALKEAIESGITMIDTSSNYMDGGAERAIAVALHGLSEEVKSKIEIVSKFGYIQGSNLEQHADEPFEEVVEYSPDCYHSISKSFIHTQLTASLKRLEMDAIGCYLVHNPEYYLLDAINRGIEKDERLDEMYRRLFESFIALEEEVKRGRILSYGISSNSFSKPQNSDEFLPYEDLLTLAESASQSVGNITHSFTTVQLPINLLERDGLKCASWAKKSGLRVLTNRPFNAQYENLSYRLCDYDESSTYYNHLNELMLACDNKVLKPMYNLLEQLDANKHKFGWIGDYEFFLYSQIIPSFKKFLEVIDKENRENFLVFIDLFLQEYKRMVLHECSKNTRVKFKDLFKECNGSMQKCSLEFLTQKDEIDYILIGMRKPFYVNEIFALNY